MSQIDELVQVMNPSNEIAEQDSHKIKVISVVSGKGGVGKSNIATNLAILYGKLGKKVLVMDADLGLANINILMGVIPRYTLNDFLQGTKLLKDIIISYNNNVDIVPGGTGFYQLVDLQKDHYKNIVNNLLKLPQYDILLIDAGAGISQSVLSFIIASDNVILVTTPEPTSLTDAYGMIKVIVANSSRSEAGIIINMAQDEEQGLKVYQKLSAVAHKFLGFSLTSLGTILEDNDLKKAVRLQKPVVETFPHSKVSLNLQYVLAKLESLDLDNKELKNQTLGSFFKKIFTFYQ